jgi:ribosomal protein S18 acetylase RimI-like enzyme
VLTFRDAIPADVDVLVEIVHAAYRGGPELGGWTTESHLLGGQRTDADGVREAMAAPGSRVLVVERDGAVVGCCQLEERERAGVPVRYFGMFAVRPSEQGSGIGRQVLAEAERIAREAGAAELQMTVIVQREDLIAYYERRGYRRTGELSPFPYEDERFGLPHRDDLAFELLVKPLG